MSSKSIIRVVVVTALLLLIPLVAMQFTDEIAWDLPDFVIMGILLLGSGFVYELATRNARSLTRRTVVGIVILGVFLLIWAELAVGVFGTPFAGS